MVARYARLMEDRGTMASAAYFCLTVLEGRAGNRKAAARRYKVSGKVLDALGRLGAQGGDEAARKHAGRATPFIEAERQWLYAALRALIRRAAEAAHDPDRDWPEITMANLPPL